MSKRRDKNFLADILEAMQRLQAYIDSLTYEDFLQDTKTQDAVIRNVEVIGEAVKRLSPALKKATLIYPGRRWPGFGIS